MSKGILDKILENPFDDIRITDPRMYNFSNRAIQAMDAANTGGRFTGILDNWRTPVAVMYAQLSSLDLGMNIQLGLTQTNDQVLAAFKKKMSDEEPFIARGLGGRDTLAYKEFYPHQLSEYTNATKTEMLILVTRAAVVGTKYEKQIGKPLADELVQLQKDWDSTRTKQTLQFATVDGTRASKSKARLDLEFACQISYLDIARLFAGDPKGAKQFVNTDLLFPLSNSLASHVYNGTTDAGTITLVVHDNLSDDTEIAVKIISVGTQVIVFVADNDKAQPVGVGKLLNPRKNAYHFTGVELGTKGSAKTYLLISNQSATDKATWEITVNQ